MTVEELESGIGWLLPLAVEAGPNSLTPQAGPFLLSVRYFGQ